MTDLPCSVFTKKRFLCGWGVNIWWASAQVLVRYGNPKICLNFNNLKAARYWVCICKKFTANPAMKLRVQCQPCSSFGLMTHINKFGAIAHIPGLFSAKVKWKLKQNMKYEYLNSISVHILPFCADCFILGLTFFDQSWQIGKICSILRKFKSRFFIKNVIEMNFTFSQTVVVCDSLNLS